MADNTALNAGAGGDTLATKEITHGGDTTKLQAVSLMGVSGTEGAYTAADINGDAANGLDVDVTRLPALVAGDNAIGRVKLTDGTDVALVSASGELNVLESNSAAIKTAVETIDNAISGSEMQVDVVGSLPAGTNAIGKLAANSGVDIGDVDVTSVPADPFGANADAAATAGGTGSIQAKLRLITSQLDSIKTAVETLDNIVGGSEAQVDIVGSLPAGTNAIGKLAANSGVDIGDVDVTSVVPGTGATNLGKAEDGGHTTGDVGVMALGVRNDTPNTALAGTDLDYVPLATYRTGAVRTAIPEEDFAALGSNHVKKYYANTGAVTDGIVWSPAAGKRWYVTDLLLTTSAAATVTFEDDKSGGDEIVAAFDLAANSGVSHHFGTPLFSGEDAADLLVTTTAGNIKISITGYEI